VLEDCGGALTSSSKCVGVTTQQHATTASLHIVSGGAAVPLPSVTLTSVSNSNLAVLPTLSPGVPGAPVSNGSSRGGQLLQLDRHHCLSTTSMTSPGMMYDGAALQSFVVDFRVLPCVGFL